MTLGELQALNAVEIVGPFADDRALDSYVLALNCQGRRVLQPADREHAFRWLKENRPWWHTGERGAHPSPEGSLSARQKAALLGCGHATIERLEAKIRAEQGEVPASAAVPEVALLADPEGTREAPSNAALRRMSKPKPKETGTVLSLRPLGLRVRDVVSEFIMKRASDAEQTKRKERIRLELIQQLLMGAPEATLREARRLTEERVV